MSNKVRYRSQTVDYLGFLQTQLRDLQGISTLAYELIQNADDVLDDDGQPAARRITFDIYDDALIVENDGVFREVDFDRVSHIASGGKREEKGTTGAFGIGFISVYQVTDCPEIFSSGQQWRIRPDAAQEGERIEIRDAETEGTRFRLPWAFDPGSEVRRKLRIETIDPSQFDEFQQEIGEALSLASLFLKQLKVLELKRSGRLIKRVEREPDGDDHWLIQDDGQTLIWRIFRGNFDTEASRLRSRYPLQIEDKRQSNILVAIPDEPLTSGRLFAVLPTETVIPLPFHLNADFFPTNDRKHILFGGDYQSEWNRAAVQAAALTLAANFDKLRDLLGHRGIWQVLRRLDDCRRQVEQNEYDPVFADFWEEIAPSLRTRPIVFTTKGQWVTPDEARLLESDVEEKASFIFESLNIPVVHSDLRPYFSLLRQKEIGTPLLKIPDIVNALTTAGLDKRTTLDHAPSVLKTVEQWETLWQAIETLLERSQQTFEEKDRSRNILRQCAIAFGPDEALWPPAQLFWADMATQTLFPEVPWLSPICEPDQVPHSLVQEFTAREAIDFLENRSEEVLEDAWRNGQLNLTTLYQWFEARKSEILFNLQLKSRLCHLPIWPASDELRPLSGLYIPGGFDDPLKLSELVDLEALGGRREFLKDLGLHELTFDTYIRVQVPRVFEENSELVPAARRQLIQLIARRLGEIRDDQTLQEHLKRLPLVECTDNAFRPATQVYAHATVATILGNHIHVVKLVKQNSDAIKALYEWLGVAQHPRPMDVINRLRELVAQPPYKAAYRTVEAIFEYLAEEWPKWEESQRDDYANLKQMAWLPSHKDTTRWYQPHQLYAVFQSYLFETQAHFLQFDRRVQDKAGGKTGFINFLGIETVPLPAQVVRHLKEYSRQSVPVNQAVYRFLNDNADDPAVTDLSGTTCLLLPDNQYVRPDQVFWTEHSFGPYRYQLGPELRQYHSLFDRLGVRERPEDQDFIEVLLEISQEYTQSHSPLDEQSLAIVMHCWENLSAALEQKRFTADDLSGLKDHPVIPNIQRMLTRPEDIFFEDRAGLAAKFPQFLENNVIVRPQGAWRAMREVGVRLLGDAVKLHVIECEGIVDDEALLSRVQHRRWLLARLIESEKASGGDDLNVAILEELHFQRARKLLINYSIQAFKQKQTTKSESVPALFLREESGFIAVYENGHVSWPAIAREIAIAIKPIGEIGGLAGGIKEVLASASPDEASRSLDELGYPPLQEHLQTEVQRHAPIEGLGGEAPTPEVVVNPAPGDPEIPETPFETIPVEPEMTFDTDTSDGSSGDSKSPEETTQSAVSGVGTSETPAETAVGPGMTFGNGHTPMTAGVGSGSDKKSPPKQKPTGWLRTYVTPNSSDTPDKTDPDGYRRRTSVGQAGVDRVLAYEAEHGRTAVDTNAIQANHPGYDIESTDASGKVRYIEVKSMEGYWSRQTPAAVTQTQFEKAQELDDQFWLYVVEFAPDDDRFQIFPIQNPFSKINQYLFDDGWNELAEFEEQQEIVEG